MKKLREERGSILVMSALFMTMLLSFMAVAIDVGNLYLNQRELQTLADAAAMAGALQVISCAGTAKCGIMTAAANNALSESGVSLAGISLTINNGPSAVAGDPNSGKISFVEAVVTENVPTYFARLFGYSTVAVTARAEAGKNVAATGNGLYTNNLTLNSGASITDQAGSNCGVYDGGPVMEDAGATVKVDSYNVQGTVTDNGGSYTPSPSKGAVQSDPLAGLTAPTQPPTSTTATTLISNSTTMPLHPGTYPGGFNLNGSGYTITLNPGLYYITGNINGGGVTFSGTGVTIYMASGQFNNNSDSTWNLTAPTSGIPYCSSCAGMLFWQPASNTSQVNLDAGSNSSFGGAIYTPGAQLTLNGGSNVASYGGVVDASSIMMNSTMTLGCVGGAADGSQTVALAE